MIKDLFKIEDDYIIFIGHYLEVYIPSSYFNSKLGENYGSDLRVFGIFNLRAYTDKMVPMQLETLNLPSLITIYPSNLEDRIINLVPDGEEEKYVVAKFYKNNKFMRKSVQQDSTNVELFVNLLLKGKIPPTVPYSKIIMLWHKNLNINKVNFKLMSITFEAMISEFYRSKKDPNIRFAKIIGKDINTSEYDYKAIGIREICSRNSTFAAMTFEDINFMIVSSINMKKKNRKQVDSPLEKIMKM